MDLVARAPRLMKTYFIAAVTFAVTVVASLAETVDGLIIPIKQVSVSSPVLQDIIAKMAVKEGDTVKEGDLIVQLRNEREALDVQLSEKLIELKKFIARGHEKLYKEEMGSEEKALEAKTDLELAQLQLEAKKINLREKTILAPLSGRVVKKYKETGESVSREEKLVDIINLDTVNVRFYLPPNLRPTLKEQAPVQVKIPDLNGEAFQGKITFIDPRNDAASGKVLIHVEIDNRDNKIAPGMKATAEFGK
jgi:membrane fusion protein (multidrug efflux system)